MANKQGLFDAAKMFELFALNICALWCGQPFKNLNTEVANYPYVDLISEDQRLFVQVSTVQDIAGKIKSTLEKVRDSKDSRFSSVENIVFFVLHNQSTDYISDFIGDAQIGNTPFTKKDHLISTQDILAKAQTDFKFQSELYDLLKADEFSTSNNEASFRSALAYSKNVGLKNIDYLIHNEYQIDRSPLVSQVKADDFRFISIQGLAGSGKSAFCKILLESEELVLYARAERFIEESDLNSIWSFDIEKVLTYINGKKLTFFIDALEFISDCRQTKFELLQQLYTIAQGYENVYVVTSCRSSEKGAFIKLETNLGIHSYLVDNLSDEELLPIAAKYPVIKKMCEMKAYSSLLRIPFYIELILEKDINPDDIHDEVALREYIWYYIICQKERARNYQLKLNEIAQTVKKIVFDRAKQNLLGIRSDTVDSHILKMLISEGILIEQGSSVRLKHDIFEDICFEQYFDEKFQECLGNYKLFYNEIEEMGRCVYRRYQIWISNKLFGTQNRAKFLYSLIFTDAIPSAWKKQTEIGIVKSKYCSSFFDEQGLNIQESGQIWDFVNITNLFAFEVHIQFSSGENPKLDFHPVGSGRPALIQLIHKFGLFKDVQTETDQTQIVKLCQDYAKQRDIKKDVATLACAIATYYVDELLNKCQDDNYYHLSQDICPHLTTIYQMPTESKDWIKTFLKQLSDFYASTDRRRARVAKDIIQWTMKNAYPQLVSTFPKELCALFEVYWTHLRDSSRSVYHNRLGDEQQFGLNEHAENYIHEFRTIRNNPFFWNLFLGNFFEGFDWVVSFTNRSIEAFVKSSPQQVSKVQLYFTESRLTKTYWGNSNMWMAGIEENQMPALISDMIYILKNVTIKMITAYWGQDDLGVSFANWIKKKLFSDSNNIALLTIIEGIGMHFQKELPGFAMDLATSIPLLHWDVQRYATLHKNPTQALLEKQILLAFGIPNLHSRYEKDPACEITLQEYVFSVQLRSDEALKQQCHQMLDYLYEIIDNSKENAADHLQIQKMDARNAEIEQIDENIIAISPRITGEAVKIVEQQKHAKDDEQLSLKIQEYVSNKGNSKTSKALELINTLSEAINRSPLGFQYENALVLLIAAVLKDTALDGNKRSELCGLWLNGIRRLFSGGSFVADVKLCPVLFQQLNSNASLQTKNEIKLLMLDTLLYLGQSGVISEISKYAQDYLQIDENTARAILNTIVKLSEDEMAHQKYNANYLKKRSIRGSGNFIPNMTPKLTGIDTLIRNDRKGKVYTSQRDAIIIQYLYEESPLDIKTFSMQNFDLSTLCSISNCGVSISDPVFNFLMREIIFCIVDVWHFHRGSHDSHKVLDLYCTSEIIALYRRQLVQSSADSECAIDLLFTDIDFSKFTDETIEFYQDIFGNFLPEFLDAWQNSERRCIYKKKIQYLEQKVNGIEDEHVRIQLYKSLFFSITRYCTVDLSQCPTNYSYEDICFLNGQFSKYGKYHLQEMLQTVYQLHIDELLPHILNSINDCFSAAKSNLGRFATIIRDNRWIVQLIIYKAFIKYSEEIKNDYQLTLAYENILETLVTLNYEDAAVLLDEFRLH